MQRGVALTGIAALLSVTAIFAPRLAREMRDFEVYWTAAARALDRAPLYRPEDGHFQFKYLPAFAIAATPIAFLPLKSAKTVWLFLSVGLIAALIALSVRLLPERRRAGWVIVAVVLVAMGKFYGHELVLGQVNLLFAVLVASGIVAMRRSRDGLAGALVMAAIVVKPYGVLLLPWLVLTRGFRSLVSVGIGALCVVIAPVGIYGVSGTAALHRAWWTTVTESTVPNLTNPDNVSLAAMFARRLGATDAATLCAAALGLLLLATAAFVVVRGRGVAGRESLEGALLLTLVPLLSPQGWDYVFLVATPAVAVLVNYDDRLPPALRALTWTAVLTIGLSLFDVMGRERYAAFMSWSVITMCFLVVVAALATLRVRRAA
ncbi:MAG: glycosyltransferase family 87 protein [Vicinamibacterales bacterium]